VTSTEVLELVGVFLGGALPWLEAVIVIPIGILAGLPPVLVVLAALAGNLLTLWLAAYYGERIRGWWQARRRRRRAAEGGGRAARVGRVFRRWGMPGLAVVGPIGLGTQLSAVVAVGFGVSARTSFWWVTAGTVAWSVLAAVLTVTGVTFLGIGA
jgi:hypothetical protein